MRRPIQTFTLCLLALGAALAASPGAAAPTSAPNGALSVELNQSRRVLLPGAAANVVVGDPTVADVAMTDAHSVVVIGKGYGATEVMITDHAGRTLLDDMVTVVTPTNGQVTVYRGVLPSEFACAERRCHPVIHNASPGGDSASAAAPQSHP
ncbi:MAG: pilus assembly protein N-terminal domain-containing protein [Caulobacteraceae bacterium]|nr:pilus assembly protein N-terminal domain-containing protein [Caulobacteraceae bacterium]